MDFVVLGFASREDAEEARRRGEELARDGVLDLRGAALAYRREDGEVELVQPLALAARGAAEGAVAGGLLGLLVLAPVLTAALGAAAGAVAAGISGGLLDAVFVRKVREMLAPGRAALFFVADAADPDRAAEMLKPLSPRVLRTTLAPSAERRLRTALSQVERGDDVARSKASGST